MKKLSNKAISILVGSAALVASPTLFVGCQPVISIEGMLPAPSIEASLTGKTTGEQSNLKSQEIASRQLCGMYHSATFGIDIDIKSIEKIDGGVQIFARAWKDGKQLGFGVDGTVDIERFRFFNPIILVDDPTGNITKNVVDFKGKISQHKQREDPTEAMRQDLAHTISMVGKLDTKIVAGKKGNTTSTFNPAAGANSPVDGKLGKTAALYTLSHDATSGDSSATSVTETNVYIANAFFGGNYNVRRAATLFDTSALAGQTISSATLSFYGNTDHDGTNGWTAKVVSVAPAATNNLVDADFNKANWGTTALSDTAILQSAWANAYNDYPLNATGLTAINQSGVSKFGLRVSADIDNTSANADGDYNAFFSADNGSNIPKLVVIHTTAAVAPSVPTYFESIDD